MTDTPPSQPNDPRAGGQQPSGQQGYGQPGHGQPGYGQQPYGGQQQVPPMRPEDEKLWATLIHLGGILFWFVPSLVGYLVLKDRGPFIREHTRVALNFQITMAIVLVASGLLSVIVIGAITGFAAGVVVVIFSIIAAVAANRGEYYKYPLSFEFIKA
ncbi:DUF4870 domain-containing protein [Frigoribacterium faeni]|uniref:DUF4870 domain-containing protein n=1 Tax=Frigoribacterium faeni TaxID=145483 RepID=A0A7W3JH50_9MICO|nr:DUF4870 domain-containing protein [Frigoribacterium faeni]MBA8812695.1 hypothetical protein [Frigoribacterium faeni]BFF13806.1 hypothetical protein GCM10025699_51090 [Microbacterium flavescens]GEK82290.1 hypothetical protein FFA01_05990 [Frigoribacterium faeni]